MGHDNQVQSKKGVSQFSVNKYQEGRDFWFNNLASRAGRTLPIEVHRNVLNGTVIRWPVQLPNSQNANQTNQQSQKYVYKFLRELSFTSQQDYQQSYIRNVQKMSIRNEHIMMLEDVKTRAQNTFCSTFYKIGLVFEYYDYSLKDQIESRILQERGFQEKEIWSLLCPCVLAMAYLEGIEGKTHCCLMPEDIKLSFDGEVKLMSNEMAGFDSYNSVQMTSIQVLASTITLCVKFSKSPESMRHCKLDSKLSPKDIQQELPNLCCSNEIKSIIAYMLKQNVSFNVLLEILQKMSGQQESVNFTSVNPSPSRNSTPSLNKSQQPNIAPGRSASNSQPRPKNNGYSNNFENTQNLYARATPKVSQYIQPISEHARQSEQSSTFQCSKNQPQTQVDQNYFHNSFPQQAPAKDLQDEPSDLFLFNWQTEQQVTDENDQNQETRSLNTERKSINVHLIHIQEQKVEKDLLYEKYCVKINTDVVEQRGQQKKIEYFKPSTNQQIVGKNITNLFTDPYLLQQIKSDLEEIKIRKSMGLSGVNQKSVDANSRRVQRASKKQQKKQVYVKNTMIQKKSMNIEVMKQASIQRQSHSYTNRQNINQSESYRLPGSRFTIDKQNLDSQRIHSQQCCDEQQQLLSQDILADFSTGFKRKSNTNTSRQVLMERNNQNALPLTSNTYVSQRIVYPNAEQTKQQLKEYPMQPKALENYKTNKSETPLVQSNNEIYCEEYYAKGRYEGSKLNGMRHGTGTFYYSEGGRYVGKWVQNRMHGQGTLYYPNGQIAYEGQWSNDKLSGKGILFNQQYREINHSFDYRDWSTVDECWIRYQGQFQFDNKHGKGILYLSNGQMLDGQFRNDQIDGQSTFHRKDGTKVRGLWRNNRLLRLL